MTPPKQRRVGLYLRVSKDNQTTDNQRIDLERVAQHRNWDIVEIYVDHAVSGKRDSRPALDRLRRDAAQGKLDIVAAWAVDRLGRNLPHVMKLLADLGEQRVGVFFHQQPQLDTTTASGKLTTAIFAAFAEFEWDMTSDRIKAGLARARKEGKLIGRPGTVTAKTKARILELRKTRNPKTGERMGVLSIAKAVGCGTSTVQRVLLVEEEL